MFLSALPSVAQVQGRSVGTKAIINRGGILLRKSLWQVSWEALALVEIWGLRRRERRVM